MPLANAQAASQAPLVVEMFLDDPEKTGIFGIMSGGAPADHRMENPFYHAAELDRQGKHKEAERLYLEMLNVDFNNTVLHAALGMNYAVNSKSGIAFRLLQYALDHSDRLFEDFLKLGITPQFHGDPEEGKKAFLTIKRSEITNAIGTCWKNENVVNEARECFEAAQALVPPNADIQNNLGTLWINEGRPEDAIRILTGALEINPNHPQAHWNRSLAMLEMGRFEEGWDEYDWGFKANVRVDRTYTKEPLPQWDGSPGKNLVIFGEQGIGDEILFMSILPEVIRDSKSVVVDCHKKLHRLFCESFPGVDFYPTREDPAISWPVIQNPDGTTRPRYPFDAKISIGSVPRFYRRTPDSFPGTPFLKAPQDSIDRWRERLDKLPRRPNIGISWEGGHKRTRKEVRSIPLARWEQILRHNANWISLQYTPIEREIHDFTKRTGITIHHWPEAVYSPDYAETAGLVANLDLVISVATSCIHLAGGLGIPCWVLTASRAAWREYYGGDSNPWYNCLTMFRQAHNSTDWEPPLLEVSEALDELLGAIK